MTINLPLLERALADAGPRLQQYRQNRGDKIALAREALQRAADNQEQITERVVHLGNHVDRMLRCAAPTSEPLAVQYPPPEPPERALLIAADGSQINPSWHAAIPMSLINVAAVVWEYAPREATLPAVFVETRLALEDELLGRSEGLHTETGVSQYRDVREREVLAEQANKYRDKKLPILALRDGPLEFWGSREPGNQAGYQENLRRTEQAYDDLRAAGAYTAGYVESRATRLLVRLLEIALEPENDHVRHSQPLAGLTDSVLLETILRPGHRSAVYRVQARAAGVFSGNFAVHMFFLNVSMDEGQPHIVRVEIPAWVACDPSALNLVQAVILEQCRCMPGRPYPYVLFRADEVARVDHAEQAQVGRLVQRVYLDAGLGIPRPTPKQASKELK